MPTLTATDLNLPAEAVKPLQDELGTLHEKLADIEATRKRIRMLENFLGVRKLRKSAKPAATPLDAKRRKTVKGNMQRYWRIRTGLGLPGARLRKLTAKEKTTLSKALAADKAKE